MTTTLSADEILRLAENLGIPMDASTAETLAPRLRQGRSAFESVEDRAVGSLPDPQREHAVPTAGSDCGNAWFVKTSITGRADGPLRGRRVALKDSIMLAGVPMRNGSDLLEGFVADRDAVVVTRILEAGGEIAGKAHCEYLSMSAISNSNSYGAVQNPRNPGHSAGGSSSGCAALLAAGEVEMAVGGDQGGSIRIPAAHCGVVGLKPTRGLVDYQGAAPVDPLLDHLGPMTVTVRDNARLLQALAGDAAGTSYIDGVDRGVTGLRVGILREGFDPDVTEGVVATAVLAAAERLGAQGATVDEVSVPSHALSPTLWAVIGSIGFATTMLQGDGIGAGHVEGYPEQLIEAVRKNRSRLDHAPDSIKYYLLLGALAMQETGLRNYGQAVNLARTLRREFDAILESCDVLVMPTTPRRAPLLPPPGMPFDQVRELIGPVARNTVAFNLTGHPAISVPCGEADGLSIGMMLVGRHHDEGTLYAAAASVEDARS